MLPAICFVFSRKQCEVLASYVELNLLDGTQTSRVEKECRSIVTKFANYHEYLELPEYKKMVGLLERGIAVHHAGILPPLREIIEIMFSRGYIKMLFATETFAVGINMPTKTVLFTSLFKFDGSGMRLLLPHE